jgi:hypothetical protein
MRTKQPNAVVSMELRVSRTEFDAQMRQWAAGWPGFTREYRDLLFDLFVKRLGGVVRENWLANQDRLNNEALRDILDGLDQAAGKRPEV